MSAQERHTPPLPVSTQPERPSRSDRLRREWYLFHLELWLEADTPHKEVKRLKDGLRCDLDAAATETSMPAAIEDLGPARALARGYRETLKASPNKILWYSGLMAASGWLTLVILTTVVFVSALWQSAGEHGEASAWLLWSHLVAVRTETEMSLAFNNVHWTALATLLAFLIGARIWRLIPRLRPRQNR